MAHFAQLDDRKRVIHVSVLDNARLLDDDGVEQEALGIARMKRLHGADTRWVQTSYNGSIRGRFAGLGYTHDEVRDVFLAPKPSPSWVLDELTTEWVPPLPKPTDPGEWEWDEDDGLWVDRDGAVSNVDFALRFSPEEVARIEASTIPHVVAVREELKRTPIVRPKHPRTINGLNILLSNGMLDHAGRAAEILDPNPTP